ncbi:hypothetical protein [Desulfosporosinus youngiae]|uniref:Uncharacterized protein n=1 Tax=Desulfosporosinus youngiae DSM 17734 TaxID=768710 RepID=H5Y2M7_9FIRM|nr:hypothetical protein [Desulfosporosinus youngiae]EHQ88290.1 hypothetical protein DesyoDRAFT_1120 [Desulfosporosinus youngiae DSM 17734]
MKWQPSIPVKSTLSPRVDAAIYKKDFKFDFVKGGFIPGSWVEGLDAFIQRFVKVLLTNETPIIKYGLYELLPKSQSQADFEQECITLSSAIVTHKFSDSTPNDPNGLGYTVEEIYGISKETLDDVNYLIVSAMITGVENKVELKVPLTLLEKNKQ